MSQNRKSFAESKFVTLLKYPALVLGLLTSAPTIITAIKSLHLGVGFSRVAQAEAQNEMWMRNSLCYRSGKYLAVATNDGKTIRVLPCSSGDILVEVRAPGSKKEFTAYWIERQMVDRSSFLSSELMAQESPPSQVLCYKQQSGWLLRILRIGQQCYKQRLDTYQGSLLEEARVPCPELDNDPTACSSALSN